MVDCINLVVVVMPLKYHLFEFAVCNSVRMRSDRLSGSWVLPMCFRQKRPSH